MSLSIDAPVCAAALMAWLAALCRWTEADEHVMSGGHSERDRRGLRQSDRPRTPRNEL